MKGISVVSPTTLTEVSTTAVVPVGTRQQAGANEYIFLKGAASTVAGSWVTFDEAGVTSLLTSNAKGRVAVALAATVADTWGWYQIYGSGLGVIGNEVSADTLAYISSVTGSVDDLLVTGDAVQGAIIRGASAVTGATVAVELNYPFVHDNVI